MKRSAVCTVLCISLLFPLSALEWPTDTHLFLRLFGQRIGEHVFEQGTVFEHAETVRAADNGTLLIALDARHGQGMFPSTLGNALVLLHNDGLQTIYGNLESAASLGNRVIIEGNSVIGRTGNSGWGMPNDLLFQVSDSERKVYINPLILLPAVADKTAPQIQNIVLVNDQNTAFQITGQRTLRQGSYELYAEISDTTEAGGHIVSPFRVSIFVNGTNLRIIPFETITQKDRNAYLSTTAFTDTLLYRRKGSLYLGKIILNRGKSDILITARDITGNEKAERFTVQAD